MAALHCLYAGGSIDNRHIALLELEDQISSGFETAHE
jgi:hypothetical protein